MTRVAPLVLLVFLGLLTACTEKAPGSHHLEMADAAFSRGEYLESERLYESYLQSNPEDDGRWTAWNRLLTISQTIRKSSPRSIQLLEAMHLEFIEDQTRLWEILVALGNEYRSQGEIEKGSAVYQKALAIAGRRTEEYVEVRFLLSDAQKKAGNFDMARTVLTEGLQTEMRAEERARMLLELSNILVYARDIEAAKATLEEILAMGLGEGEILILAVFSLGDLAEQQGEYQRARELFASIVHTHPNPAAVRSRLNSLDKTLGSVQPPGE
jgi:tetratricopeptide (TPR) repeat protein